MVLAGTLRTVRGRLLLPLVLAFVALFTVQAYYAVAERHERMASVAAQLLASARLIAAEQDDLVEHANHILRSVALLAQRPEALSPAKCRGLLAKVLAREPRFSNIAFVQPNGDMTCAAVPLPRALNIADREYFRKALHSTDTIVSDVIVSRATGQPAIAFAKALVDEQGHIRGVVSAALSLSWLSKELAKHNPPAGAAYAVVNGRGTVVARYPNAAEWIGKSVANSSLFKLVSSKGGDGTVSTAGIDGVRRVFAFTPLLDGGLDRTYLWVGVPTQTVLGPVEQGFMERLGITALILSALFGATWWGTEHLVVRRVRRLSDAAAQFGAGERTVRTGLQHTEDEVGQLARSFDAMAQSVQASEVQTLRANTELKRVNRALRVLSAGNRVLLRAKDEQTLLQEMCRAVVEAGGYRMAWVGYAEQGNGKAIRPMAHWGSGDADLGGVPMTWDETDYGHGPVGIAIRTGLPVAIQNIPSDPRFAPWREAAAKHGYASCVSLPVRVDGATIGALTLYEGEPEGFGTETLPLLGETAADLAFGIATVRGQAERARIAQSLKESEARFKAAFEGSLNAVFIIKSVRDEDGNVVDFELENVNRRAEEMLEMPREKFLGSRHSELFPNIKAEGKLQGYVRVMNTGKALEEDILVHMPNGKRRWLRHQLVPLRDGLAVSARDITDERQRALELRQSLDHLAETQKLAHIGTWIFDPRNGTVTNSDELSRLLGLQEGAPPVPIERMFDFVHPDERASAKQTFEAMLERKTSFRQEHHIVGQDGAERYLMVYGEPKLDAAGNVVSVSGYAQDITERRQYEARIDYLATHDALTDLPNRRMLDDRLSQSIAHVERRPGEVLAVLHLDLDRFKLLNDSFGYAFGDAFIKAVAQRLQAAVRDGDTVGRQGADEFIVLLTDIRRPEDVLVVVRKIQEAFTRPFIVEHQELYATCSVGAGMFPSDGKDIESLLASADSAMHRAKLVGGGGFEFYTSKLSEQASERVKLENALRRAIEKEEFELHYQPQVSLTDGRIVGAEALIRWRHPEMGLVSPARFIPLAEETGLIIPIGDWALKTACAQNQRWRDTGFAPMRVAVNVSAYQFRHADIHATVVAMKAQNELSHDSLELEVTESVVMHDIKGTVAKLTQLRGEGIIISVDDFGTGYSSLSYLRHLPISKLKIDQSFVQDIESGEDARTLVRAIINLAHAFRFGVIAEGVETEEQLKFLMRHGCDEAQGYYFSKPLAVDDFAPVLDKGRFLVPTLTG